MTEPSGHERSSATTPEAATGPGASLNASSSDVPGRTEDVERVVVFRIGEQCYALPMSRVQEVQQIAVCRHTQIPSQVKLGWVVLLRTSKVVHQRVFDGGLDQVRI